MELCKTKTISCLEGFISHSSWFKCLIMFRANDQTSERRGRERGREQDSSANLWRHGVKQGESQEDFISIFLQWKPQGQNWPTRCSITEWCYQSRKNIPHRSPTYWLHLGPYLSWNYGFFTYRRGVDLSRCSAGITQNISWPRPRVKPCWCSDAQISVLWPRSHCHIAYL